MKRQDIVKLHQQTLAALASTAADLVQELKLARLKIKLGQQKNVHQVKTLRHQLARVKTIHRAKELTPPSPTLTVTPKKGTK